MTQQKEKSTACANSKSEIIRALTKAESKLIILREYASYIRNELMMKPRDKQRITFIDLDSLDEISLAINDIKAAQLKILDL